MCFSQNIRKAFLILMFYSVDYFHCLLHGLDEVVIQDLVILKLIRLLLATLGLFDLCYCQQ